MGLLRLVLASALLLVLVYAAQDEEISDSNLLLVKKRSLASGQQTFLHRAERSPRRGRRGRRRGRGRRGGRGRRRGRGRGRRVGRGRGRNRGHRRNRPVKRRGGRRGRGGHKAVRGGGRGRGRRGRHGRNRKIPGRGRHHGRGRRHGRNRKIPGRGRHHGRGRRHRGGRGRRGRHHRGRGRRGRRHRGRGRRGRRRGGWGRRGRRHRGGWGGRGRRHRGGHRGRGWGAVGRHGGKVGAGAALGALGVAGAIFLGFDTRNGVDCVGANHGNAQKLHRGICSFNCMIDLKCTGFVYGGGNCQLKGGKCKKARKAGYIYHSVPPRSEKLLNSFVMHDGQCIGSKLKRFRARSVLECIGSCKTNGDCVAVHIHTRTNRCKLMRRCKRIASKKHYKTFMNVMADTYTHRRGKCKSGLGSAVKKSFAHCQRLCTQTKTCQGFVFNFGASKCQTMNKRCADGNMAPGKLVFTYNKMTKHELTKKCSAGQKFSWVRYTGVSLLMIKPHRKMIRVNNLAECDRECKQSADFACTSFSYKRNVCTLFKMPPEKGTFSCASDSTVVEKACRVTGLRKRGRRRSRRKSGGSTGMCKCSWSGDPHYRSFDGYMIHFMGRCKYTAVETMVPDDPCRLKVFVKNTDRGNSRSRVTWTKYTEIKFAGDDIRFNSITKTIQINGGTPTKYAPKCRSTSRGFYRLLKSGHGFLFEAPQCQITVQMSPYRATVTVPPKYRGNRKMRGICGDCNGRKDDLRTKDGSAAKGRGRAAYKQVGDSYLVHDKEAVKTQCVVKEDFGCSKQMDRLVHKPQFCGLISKRNGPFKQCIASKKINVKEFEESCKIDVCSYKNDDDAAKSASCHNVKQFAKECETQGFKVKWRTPEFCPIKCPRNQVYRTGVTACPATCENRRAPTECELPLRSGCVCKSGYILSGSKCVRKKYCAKRIVGDLTIILDGTKHIEEPDFSKQKEFIVFVLEKFMVDPKALEVQFIQFGTVVDEVIPIGKYSDLPDLLRKIRRVTYEGGLTQSSEALSYAKIQIAGREKVRPSKVAPKILLYVTNRDPMEDDLARRQLTLMALKDIKIIIVGMVSTDMPRPAVTYGQIRHLIINTNTKPIVTTKWVVVLIENEAKCGSGMYYDGVQCKDIDECALKICPRGSKCINIRGSYKCFCERGFIWSNKGCFEINECYNRPCLRGSKCKNVPGTYECTCRKGLEYNMKIGCQDRNECVDNPGICRGGSTCTNKYAGYDCNCGAGKAYIPEKKTCVAKNPCLKKPCKGSSKCVALSESKHECKCPYGFAYRDTCGCVEVSLCNKDPCGKGVTCKSKVGGFICICPKGQRWRKKKKACVATDPCRSRPCKGSARCASDKKTGAYTCTCRHGNVYDERAGCVLPDEITPFIESVFIIDDSKRVTPEEFELIKQTLQQITVGLAGKSPTIHQSVITSGNDAHLVMEPEERIMDQVIHEIGELKPKQSANSNFPEAFELVAGTIFKAKPVKPTYRVVTAVIAGTPSKPLSQIKPHTDKLRAAGVHVQIINVGKTKPGKMTVLTKPEDINYMYFSAMLIPAHTYIINNILEDMTCPPNYARVGKYCQAITKSTPTCTIDKRKYGLKQEKNNNCVVTKCTRIGPEIVRTECRRADGKCVPVGTKRFPCFKSGVFQQSCSCKMGKPGVVIYITGPKWEILPYKTHSGKACVIPFVYKNKVHFHCVEESGTPSWCSLTMNYDKDKKRGGCAPLEKIEDSCDMGGRSYQLGETWRKDCVKYECKKNPKDKTKAFIFVVNRCQDAEGNCVDQDSTGFPCKLEGVRYDSCTCNINDQGVAEYTIANPNLTEIEVLPGENTSMKFSCAFGGKLYRHDQTFTAHCVTLRCDTSSHNNPVKVVKKLCERNDGRCLPLKSKNFKCKLGGADYDGCRCEQAADSGSAIMYWYMSNTGIMKAYELEFSMLVTREATCMSKGKSYKENQEWVEDCVKMKCVGEMLMKTMILERQCQGADGKCYPLNTQGFPCKILGKKYNKCACGSDSENRILYEVMVEVLPIQCHNPDDGKFYNPGQKFVVACHTMQCLEGGAAMSVSNECADTKGKCHKPDTEEVYECALSPDVTSPKCMCMTDPVQGVTNFAVTDYVTESFEIDFTQIQLEESQIRGEMKQVEVEVVKMEVLKKKKK